MLLEAVLAGALAAQLVPPVSNRFSFGHVCPISAEVALTAAHVIDPRPFDPGAPMTQLVMRNEDGTRQILTPIATIGGTWADLAMVGGRFPTAMVFPLAKVSPAVGDTLYISGFELTASGRAFRRKVTKAKVTSLPGGSIVIDKNPDHGSSGSCVLNEAGEVVGIEVWGFSFGGGQEASAIVDVSGESLESLGKDVKDQDALKPRSPEVRFLEEILGGGSR